ncbi:glycosyltransferase family 4 protein [Patescibacteria group bacterium]|nr:glycosyltransferase family 4 protein [Patescibacteria group bacterium]
MKVGIDGRYAEGKLVGIGKYIKNLSSELAALGVECVIFYSKRPLIKIQYKKIKQVVLGGINRYVFEQFLLPKALKKEGVDLFHAASNVGVPLFSTVPAVLTVHDLIPLEIKNYFSFAKFPFLSKWSYVSRMQTSCIKAKKIISVSKYTKEILIKRFGIPEDKISVVYSGITRAKGVGKLPPGLIKKKYVLNNGGIDIRKNIDRLITAFGEVYAKHPDFKLVITGDNHTQKPKLQELVNRKNLGGAVIFPGYVNEETLWALIRSAACICYPTLIEGFGFPVLEGFVAGTPVISSDSASIPEIAADAAILVNPRSETQIASAIEKVITNTKLSAKMVRKGRVEARKYNWRKTARETLEIYKEAL